MRPPRPLVPDSVASLTPLVDAGVLDAPEVAVADAVARLVPPEVRDTDDFALVTQAVAIAALGRRLGHSCVDLSRADALCATAARAEQIEWTFPTVAAWIDALASCELVQFDDRDDGAWDRPLVLDAARGRLWLARFASSEQVLTRRLIAMATSDAPFGDATAIAAAVETAFATSNEAGDVQRTAVRLALEHRVSFIVGGPGTGKTWTVGRLLEAFAGLGAGTDARTVALAAPTGKAAERLTEAVGGAVQATTLHRLLGLRPDSPPGVDPPRGLTHDLIVVDEASMIDLAMMTRLTGAIAPEAHLVFVGDPDQLLSVEVGSVLRDVVDAAVAPESPLHGTVAVLDRSHRFGGDLADLAEAIRQGDGDGALGLLDDPDKPAVELVEPNDAPGVARLARQAVDRSNDVVAAARAGDAPAALAAARSHKVLTAIRHGRFGLDWWNGRIAAGVGHHPDQWAVGRAVIVTRNDPANGVFNGDTGVVVPDPEGSDELMVALAGSTEPRLVAPTRLRNQEDWWAMTVHKSQGSEFAHVVVSLPEVASPILSRELLYTAVTRAKSGVTILGSPDQIRATAARRVERASGLRDRLSGDS